MTHNSTTALLMDLEAAQADLPLFQAVVRTEIKKAGLDLREVNDTAAAIARESAAHAVTHIGQDTAESLRRLIRRALDEGWEHQTLVDRIQNRVGLTPAQSLQVDRYREKLVADGMPKGKARRASQAFARQLKATRADLIAQHEVRWALAEAQRVLWKEQAELGDLSVRAVRRWVVHPDERTCKICRPLEGQLAPVLANYPSGHVGPPIHPRCRCTEKIVTP